MRLLLLGLLLALIAAGSAAAAPSRNNVTIMTYDPGHGTQVEYYDASGHTWLWYPGNRVVLPGEWKIEPMGGHQLICFRYGANTYNPVTGSRGKQWECMPLGNAEQAVVERKKGDVFGLSTGKLPFVLTRTKTTIARLRKGPVPEEPAPPPLDAATVCAEFLADQTTPTGMSRAAITYYHGIALGEPCVKVDYLKAFDLLRRAGDTRTYNSLLKDLRTKAASGNPRAIAALEKLE